MERERLYEDAARHIAKTCLALKEGEHVLICGGIHQYDLLSKIALHARKLGAHPDLSISDDETSVRMLTEVDEKFILQDPRDHDFYMARLYDAALHIDAMQDRSKLAKVPSELLGKISAKKKPLQELKYENGRRTIAMAWPTKDRAARAGITLDELEEIFWNAVLLDLDEMNALHKKLEKVFEEGRKVRIRSEKGSDIVFDIGDRKVLIDAGHYDEQSSIRGEIMKNLPCGEVYTTPLEESPEGTAIFDEVYMQKGDAVKNLRCHFEKGKLVESSADENYQNFKSLWDAAEGDKDQIAEFAIGTNPAVLRPIGDPLFDEKVFGSVHLAIGESRMYGGKSEASIHWDFVMLEPSVEIDDKSILVKGKFVL